MNSDLICLSEAKQLASDFLGTGPLPQGFAYVILDEYTIERPRCFVFFYESSRFLETGRFEDRLAGNAPILVDRKVGIVQPLGTAQPVENYIAEYEAHVPENAD
jgi:hypothetical protein